jgi:hypothetical protein
VNPGPPGDKCRPLTMVGKTRMVIPRGEVWCHTHSGEEMDPDGCLYQTGVGTVHPRHRLTLYGLIYGNQILNCGCVVHRRGFSCRVRPGLYGKCIFRGVIPICCSRHGKLIVSLHVHIVVRFDACGRDIMVSITRYVDKFEVAFHVC